MPSPRKKQDGTKVSASYLSPSKARSRAGESERTAEPKITPVKKRKLDIEDQLSIKRKQVKEEVENTRCPENLPLLGVVSAAIGSKDLTAMKLTDLKKLYEVLRNSTEEIVSMNGSNLSAEEVRSNRSKARLLIENCTKDRKTSIVASIVCDYVDNGVDGIGYLEHVQRTGTAKGFWTMVPSWSWMGKSLNSLYELGLSRFR